MAFQGAEQAPAGCVPHLHGAVIDPLTMKRPSGLTATAFTASVWPARERSRRPFGRPTPSPCGHPEPLTMVRPSGLTATANHPIRMAFQGAEQAAASKEQRSRPLPSAPHTFTVRSPEPLTMKRPSGLTATARTQSVWPSRERSRRPLGVPHLHRAGVSSDGLPEPLTMKRPSGLTATAPHPIRMAFQGAEQAPAGRPTPSPCGLRSR
jgi:hypothetical protein